MKEKHTYRHTDALGELPEALRANPYRVPDGYFNNLYLQTIEKCRDRNGAGTSFSVPDGYFDQLTGSITAKIAEQTLNAAVNEPGFVVPHGYFKDSEQLLVATSKIDAVDTGFTVPAGYFDTLPDRIGDHLQQAIPPIRNLRRSTWAAYAAAASIALVLGLLGMFSRTDDTSETESPLASVSDEQIIDYLELYGPPNDMIYISGQLDDFDEQSIGEGISEEDIEAYLNQTL